MRRSQIGKRALIRVAQSPLRFEFGFTLVEMMVTITILAILLGIAVPSMNALVRDQRVKAATFEVYSAFAFARSEAIKRNANVIITPNASDWSAGWQIQANAVPLKSHAASIGISITGPAGAVAYQRDGRISGVASPTFLVKSSDDGTIAVRCIGIDLSGRPSIKVDTNHNPIDGCQ